MNKSDKRFSDYLFAKMSATDAGIGHIVVGIGDDIDKTTNNITPTTNDKSQPLIYKKGEKVEGTNFKKWLQDNMMLLVTLSGVIMGILIGEYSGNKQTI